MQHALTVTKVSKAYKRYPSKWARAWEWLSQRPQHKKLWVLKDIDFRINPGEAVGIIGMNGAGKSTLLKIITGTTQATTGDVKTSGRVAALLELGMGFHPDFTGRQNVFMAGQLLGLSPAEIAAHMSAIEAFAEIGDYIDRPVRMYSSGMQMRLAFSVATAVRPDLLIVDEALSVGDAYFQHKSFDRIRAFRDQGSSLLIVSHDRAAIQSICDRAILLNQGCIALQGDPETVMDYYTALLASNQPQKLIQTKRDSGKQRTDSGTLEAEIVNIQLLDKNEKETAVLEVAESVIARISVRINTDIESLVLGFGVKDRFGQMIFGTNTWHTRQQISQLTAGETVTFNVGFQANLGVGSYSIHCSLVKSESHVEKNFHWIDRAAIFEVINTTKPLFVGCSWNRLNFEINRTAKAID
ncbi:ABC transporter ATP-binding protein [Vandammella animalimorsus]|uniref:ABC transporter ATP-binding protein n=1 Tax=Vandammella animalimorsus TaxID=2029117 RepID=UPI00325A8DAA